MVCWIYLESKGVYLFLSSLRTVRTTSLSEKRLLNGERHTYSLEGVHSFLFSLCSSLHNYVSTGSAGVKARDSSVGGVRYNI